MTDIDPRRQALREALLLWGIAFLAIVVTFTVARSLAKPVATVAFLYLPLWAMRRRGEDYRDYGLTLRAWREDLLLVAAVSLLVLPLFTLGFWGATAVRPHLSGWAQAFVAPLGGQSRFFHPRLPERFGLWVIDQVFVVALPEEFFYRGYLQARLRQTWPQGARILGATVGPAFLLVALLFALGHLAVFQAWRLAVFFPALLFGYLRERTGTVLGSTLLHALFNFYAAFLELSFTPLWQRR
ncbi:MAG TPA: MXAN_2755 family glutamic-type intramembrane protease [Myxococcaceae bacterium]|nr:MXAN_2755 family glutamic-type intramembrane protease [Myxococcaceae bacterium]